MFCKTKANTLGYIVSPYWSNLRFMKEVYYCLVCRKSQYCSKSAQGKWSLLYHWIVTPGRMGGDSYSSSTFVGGIIDMSWVTPLNSARSSDSWFDQNLFLSPLQCRRQRNNLVTCIANQWSRQRSKCMPGMSAFHHHVTQSGHSREVDHTPLSWCCSDVWVDRREVVPATR